VNQNITAEEMLKQPSCVGTVDNVSCYPYATTTHTNTDTVLLIGGFITLIAVAIVIYRIKFGGK
jgi:hypothetical protein